MDCLLLVGENVDDFLADWSKYCREKSMLFAAPASDTAHSFLVTSGGHEARINIENHKTDYPYDTLMDFLNDYVHVRRYLKIVCPVTEEELRQRVIDEDDVVGFIF